MKKVAFSMILVITITFFYNYLPVSATSTTLPSDVINYSDLIGLQDLGYALIGGAQFNLDDSKYVIEDYSALSAAGKLEAEREKIKEFLHDYELSRGIGYSYNESSLYQGQSYYTTAFTQNANRIQEEYSISSENVDYAMGISPFKFADWAQYNRFWINRYSSSFEDSSEVVNPPPDFSFVSNINNFYCYSSSFDYVDFFNYSLYGWYSGAQSRFYEYIPKKPLNEFSFTSDGLNGDFLNYHTLHSSGNYNNLMISASNTIISIYISINQDQSCSVNYQNVNMVKNIDVYNGIPSQESVYTGTRPAYQINGQGSYSSAFIACGGYSKDSNNNNFFTNFRTDFPDFSTCINTIFKCFCNVNIYVDNEPWVIVGDVISNNVIPDFPDVIQNEENLAYDIPFPNTDNYEGSFDITSIFDALKQAIIDASDTDNSTVGVLTGEDVVSTYDGVDIDTQDRVVDLTSTKVFAGTLEDTTTDRLPDIPVPPIGVHNGLAGANVLAKYIDATQCILPEELVSVFWGGFFILIILGLIKSLHR